jgi:hypothetical protein
VGGGAPGAGAGPEKRAEGAVRSRGRRLAEQRRGRGGQAWRRLGHSHGVAMGQFWIRFGKAGLVHQGVPSQTFSFD